MNNLLPAYYAKKNAFERLEEIKQTEQYNNYIDMIYQAIRGASQAGKLGVEIRLNHPLIRDLPIEVISTLVGLELHSQGYDIHFAARKKYAFVQIFWGMEDKQ